MTFKVKGGIQIGANSAFDADALMQQIESTPSLRPSLLLDFAKSQTVDSRATFLRSSSATVVDQEGFIRTVANNQPRIEFTANGSGECEGLLIEVSKSNQFDNTETFWNTSAWVAESTYVAPNAGVAPDGTYTATRVNDTVDATSTFHLLRTAGVSVTANTTYTFSMFVKQGELNVIGLYPLGGGNGCHFNVSTGTLGSADTGVTQNIKAFANGWFRVSATTTASSTGTASPRIYLESPSTNYVGNNNGLFIWGAQWETQSNSITSSTPSSYIPSTHTFTSRSSNATYIDSNDGLIKTAQSNVVRYNYNQYTGENTSMLLEPAATNVMQMSERLDQAPWGNATAITITSNTVTAPDGTVTADTVTKAAGSAYAFHRQGFAAQASNTYYTFSMFVKKNNYRYVGLRAANGNLPSGVGGGQHAVFDFDNERFIVAPPDYKTSFQRLVNGWYRLTATTMNLVGSTVFGGIAITNAAGDELWDSTGLGALSVYAWGAQLEVGQQYATSYIPTPTTSGVTRAADVFSSSGSTRASETVSIPISSVNLKPYEGTMTIEGKVDGEILNNQYLYSLGDGTVNSLIAYRVSGGAVQFVNYNRGISQGSLDIQYPYTSGTSFKGAVSFANTRWTSSSNGVIVNTQDGTNTYGIPPYGTITIGHGYSQTRRAYFKNVAYYPKALSNTELNSITSS